MVEAPTEKMAKLEMISRKTANHSLFFMARKGCKELMWFVPLRRFTAFLKCGTVSSQLFVHSFFNNICTPMHYTALSGSGGELSFGRDGWEGVCLWAGSPVGQGRRWLEVEAGPCSWIWSCFWWRFSLPPPLFTLPASFRGEVGKCEEQQTAGSRWPCACQWGQWAQVPLSLCSQCDKDGPLHLCSSHSVPTVE